MNKAPTTLNTTCFTVQDGCIVEGTLNNFACFIEISTRPTGVGNKHYVKIFELPVDEDDNGFNPALLK